MANAEVAGEWVRQVAAAPSSGKLRRPDSLQVQGLLDADIHKALTEVARLTALCCEVPVALISLVGSGVVVQASTATPSIHGDHLLPFFPHVVAAGACVMVVPDARRDERFAGNSLVMLSAQIVFFASAPIMAANGDVVGFLCIADPRERDLGKAQRQMLQGFATQASEQLELRSCILMLEARLESQSRTMFRLKSEQRELQRQNATDPLTGLGNRRSFHDRVSLEIARAECTGSKASLIMFDVDHFKSYNDSFGHPAGDAVLKQLADVILRSCRAEDFAARVGGEEFAVLLPETSGEGAVAFARWLGRCVQRQRWVHRAVTISAGVAEAARGESGLQLAARADVALYRSKRDGRNRVTLSEGHFQIA
jgi:diguanylate cyclase (GGDEF)-like protein